MVSDGEIWDIEGVVKRGLLSEQRVFAAGIGNAPAEELFYGLSRKTSGSVDFLSHGQPAEPIIKRLHAKMQTPLARDVRIDWAGEPLWETPISPAVFEGETILAAAEFRELPAKGPVLTWSLGGHTYRAQAESIQPGGIPDLVRLAGARRLETFPDTPDYLLLEPGEALKAVQDLAVKYQLISRHTSMIMVHDRDNKIEDLPVLLHVPQMEPSRELRSSLMYSKRLSNCFFIPFSAAHPSLDEGEAALESMLLDNEIVSLTDWPDLTAKKKTSSFSVDRSIAFDVRRPKRRAIKPFSEAENLPGSSGPDQALPPDLGDILLDALNQAAASGQKDLFAGQVRNSQAWSILEPAAVFQTSNLGLSLEAVLASLVNHFISRNKTSVQPSRQALRLLRLWVKPITKDQQKTLEEYWTSLIV
jgi:hypothetical protein